MQVYSCLSTSLLFFIFAVKRGCGRTNLNESKAHAKQPLHTLGVLVKPRRQPCMPTA